jgi:hypothetical protein
MGRRFQSTDLIQGLFTSFDHFSCMTTPGKKNLIEVALPLVIADQGDAAKSLYGKIPAPN